jgi:ATP-dependent protease HslVU (ClpYQ) peptidase subunit
MTTIAYNHKDKQIAVDSQSTMGSMISSLNENKWIERDGLIFFIAGNACDDEMLITALAMKRNMKDFCLKRLALWLIPITARLGTAAFLVIQSYKSLGLRMT